MQQSAFNRPTPSNITSNQWYLVYYLKNNDEYIVIECDKNLGACILDRDTYITRGITEHLGNIAVYKKLTKQQAKQKNHNLRYQFMIWLSDHQSSISPAEYHYLHEAMLRYPEKLAKFRMSLKAHKDPWKMRPIVCCVGTFINCLSKWVDYWFQKLTPLVKTYLKDSSSLLDMLESIGDLPANAYLFTADANSMYTNIDTPHAISVIGRWLDALSKEGNLPADFPTEAVKSAMTLVMENNIFEWGDLHFLQLLGTAMGTSCACMWATIYFWIHESTSLLPKFNNKLLLLKRYIDDMIGIWLCDSNPSSWEEFKKETNNFGILTWEFEEPSTSVNFLDLTINIENNRIRTRTYQKAMNLYQYIPPRSAHPRGMMKGIIYGLMRNYWRQNTRAEDYQEMALLLFQRHVARGWNQSVMRDFILQADAKLQSATPSRSSQAPSLSNKERLFIHLEFHPNDISRNAVREIYDRHCKEVFEKTLGIQQVTVAYSRAPNIKDTLTRAKLHQAPGKPASKYYEGELVTN